jgi:hypothetical protein
VDDFSSIYKYILTYSFQSQVIRLAVKQDRFMDVINVYSAGYLNPEIGWLSPHMMPEEEVTRIVDGINGDLLPEDRQVLPTKADWYKKG